MWLTPFETLPLFIDKNKCICKTNTYKEKLSIWMYIIFSYC